MWEIEERKTKTEMNIFKKGKVCKENENRTDYSSTGFTLKNKMFKSNYRHIFIEANKQTKTRKRDE